jgi:hypothetical protein
VKPDLAFIESLYQGLEASARQAVDQTVDAVVRAVRGNAKVVVVTGSGPNIHEGVTTLIAELMRKGIIHGVSTSSAVIAHEMAGALDRVHRVDGGELGLAETLLPKGGLFEVTLLADDELERLASEMVLDLELVRRARALPGNEIIKAAGNMGYPMGLRTERLALEVAALARSHGLAFERVAGLGADPMTMIGAGAQLGIPVLVTVPQLVGGGMVGMAIADSIPVSRRSALMAELLAGAEVIIESGVALTQEVHDGPLETYTGHGIWTAWEGGTTYSLKGKTLVRIDLDPNLRQVWEIERSGGEVQASIDKGLPKTKTFKVPFRMEMSGFARLESSIPIVADLGVVWPVLAWRTARELEVELDFISYPQESEQGRRMREWIVEQVGFLDRERMLKRLQERMLRRQRELEP